MKQSIFLLAGLGAALTANAAPNVAVHCGANQERVWVYDNITSFDVGARLKCGDSVTPLGLEKGYVRVRTADGYEGYVATSSIPSEVVATLAPPASPAPATSAPMVVAPAPAAVPQSFALVSAPTSPAASSVTPVAPVVVRSVNVPQPASPPSVAVAPAPIAQEGSPTVSVAAVSPGVASARAASVSARTAPQTTASVAMVAAPTKPIASTVTTSVAPSAPKENAVLTIEPATTPISITASASPRPAMVKAADITSSRIVSANSQGARKIVDLDDADDDMPDAEAGPSNDLASCNVFFSAYGATPGQIKWFADNRRKQFPGVCPAPEPSMVDYVVIFTHDNNFYTSSMPEPIHTDKNGFSDWSPVTAVDDTLVPASEQDKSRHEYAWVFRIGRGSFDPAKFSSRRRPQFTKTEHGSSRAAEDAIGFMAQGGVAQ
jgi:hypothetical protein